MNIQLPYKQNTGLKMIFRRFCPSISVRGFYFLSVVLLWLCIAFIPKLLYRARG
ncbi:hypothetical protein BO85DRAFT_452638 [Aspergillus piperis CBS 112811]|uniref:Uncharacterized protein n=1 Tax=Aspergillus piperis CBS 112811 TaxID=1448313 RepID=A0A8G1VIE4_9EURO|nr:hypothetical protein BO85DRAFT_452638 [Aspergillus piperis CBS 112811]RAH54276.1 hypothetical protein BO85DRAFT_452638 [Aspergillus piperis CBS 112811]